MCFMTFSTTFLSNLTRTIESRICTRRKKQKNITKTSTNTKKRKKTKKEIPNKS